MKSAFQTLHPRKCRCRHCAPVTGRLTLHREPRRRSPLAWIAIALAAFWSVVAILAWGALS